MQAVTTVMPALMICVSSACASSALALDRRSNASTISTEPSRTRPSSIALRNAPSAPFLTCFWWYADPDRWSVSVDRRKCAFRQGLDQPQATPFQIRDLTIDGFEALPLDIGDLIA